MQKASEMADQQKDRQGTDRLTVDATLHARCFSSGQPKQMNDGCPHTGQQSTTQMHVQLQQTADYENVSKTSQRL
jgi:hypothetical protein